MQATISFLMVDCRPNLRRSLRPYHFLHAQMQHRICDVLVSPREASRQPYSCCSYNKIADWIRNSMLYKCRPSYHTMHVVIAATNKRSFCSVGDTWWPERTTNTEFATNNNCHLHACTHTCAHLAHEWHRHYLLSTLYITVCDNIS